MRCKAGLFSRNQIRSSLLLHLDGTNGSTTFTDSSSNSHSVTAYGDAQISTAQSKFGGASALFDGTDRLDCAVTTINNFGTADYTIEFWLRLTDTTGTQFLYLSSTSGEIGIYYQDSTLIVTNTNVDGPISEAWTPSANQWYHIALARSSGTARLFVDGTLLGSYASSETYAGAAFCIGGTDLSGYESSGTIGYIDEFRITKDFAHYTAAFTPPTAAFNA